MISQDGVVTSARQADIHQSNENRTTACTFQTQK